MSLVQVKCDVHAHITDPELAAEFVALLKKYEGDMKLSPGEKILYQGGNGKVKGKVSIALIVMGRSKGYVFLIHSQRLFFQNDFRFCKMNFVMF